MCERDRERVCVSVWESERTHWFAQEITEEISPSPDTLRCAATLAQGTLGTMVGKTKKARGLLRGFCANSTVPLFTLCGTAQGGQPDVICGRIKHTDKRKGSREEVERVYVCVCVWGGGGR
eukprot:Sspe_Gene.16234::Locus_5717_Transcript_1_1_Confidence_1.000_Length_2938::g.16234::m.16234